MAIRINGGKRRSPSLVITERQGRVGERISIPLTRTTKTGRKREIGWGWWVRLFK